MKDAHTELNSLAWDRQRQASAPGQSVWVAASAGSGKTKVLTDRVLRLLLNGARADRILCLTFTKAAAAEMDTRIASRLSNWSVLPCDKLAAQLIDLTGEFVDAKTVERARLLFASVLDAPGGLKVQTIHGFCQSVLQRFPLEAGLPPRFDVLDERTAVERMRLARDLTIMRAQHGKDPALGAALADVSARVSEDGLSELVTDLLTERARLKSAITKAGGLEALSSQIKCRLGVSEGETDSALVSEAAREEAFDGPGLRAVCGALSVGSKTDLERAALICGWLETEGDRASYYERYKTAFLTKRGAPRLNFATKTVTEKYPEVGDILFREAERLVELEARRRALDLSVRTVSLMCVADSIFAHYETLKRGLRQVDYDDLIIATRDLLARPGVAPWVLYKLDGGLDHILIDEAQDTNPEQWQIVELLAAEFFAGESAAETRGVTGRTIFAVGDTKQSIFSFQRADPRGFLDMRARFGSRVTAVGRTWNNIDLEMSFRSAPAVLTAVDAVFNQDIASDGVLDNSEAGHAIPLRHSAYRSGQAGLVELWAPEMPLEEQPQEVWRPPVRQRETDEPRRRLARRIASTIRSWIDKGEILQSKGRPIQAGDIMILLRRRGLIVADLVSALKGEKIDVAGVDRMVLTDQIAVMDLVALGRFLLLPDDDLTLATVLKGPFIGFSEEQLFDLCWDRKNARLWVELASKCGQNEDFGSAYEALSAWRRRVDFTPPYELFAEILANDGRRRIRSRLGSEADDPIDEFLNQALKYEHTHAASLEGLLHWLAAADFEVKRDLETGQSDQVRILTVHGSKGLQAPIVFLPDTMSAPDRTPKLLWDEGSEGQGGVAIPIWSPSKNTDDGVAANARAAAAARRDREYRRLLYVAMTRAQDRLYVAGWGNKRPTAGAHWHRMVEAGLEGLTSEQNGRRVLKNEQTDKADGISQLTDPPFAQLPLPEWARRDVVSNSPTQRPLAPSRLESDRPVFSPFADGDAKRFRRGRIIHYLLQWLPTFPSVARQEMGRRYLERSVHNLTPSDCERYLGEVIDLIDNPGFSSLFSEHSVAEVPIVGTVGEDQEAIVLSGRIDRLVVNDDEVLVVDFKTNHLRPGSTDEVPRPYLRQMSAYRSLVSAIYPNKSVRCALLWTDGPTLMMLPDHLLDVVA